MCDNGIKKYWGIGVLYTDAYYQNNWLLLNIDNFVNLLLPRSHHFGTVNASPHPRKSTCFGEFEEYADEEEDDLSIVNTN